MIIAVPLICVAQGQTQKVFEEKYQAWKTWMKNNPLLSDYTSNREYQAIVNLGLPVLPYLIQKIENNPEDFHLECAVSRISMKTFEKSDWPQNKLGDSITAAKMYANWWKDERFKTGAKFTELYNKWKTLKTEKKDKETNDTYQQIVNLGIPVLPYLIENVEKEPDFIIAISKLTGRQVSMNATGPECKQWWENNKQNWNLPKAFDNK
jgi:hypothetical protein